MIFTHTHRQNEKNNWILYNLSFQISERGEFFVYRIVNGDDGVYRIQLTNRCILSKHFSGFTYVVSFFLIYLMNFIKTLSYKFTKII